jgi:hypothetical protein
MDQHPESAGVAARIPEPRTGSPDPVPAWPAGLIRPSGAEVLRWFDLWGHPRATEWVKQGREHMVVALVRLEVRCGQPHPADDHFAQLEQLRHVLGLAGNAE